MAFKTNLVGGIPTPLKNMGQLGLFFLIYGKIKLMFQTTNQQLNVGQKSPCVLDSKLP